MDSTSFKEKWKKLFKGSSKSSGKNSSSTADSRPDTPHLQTKASSASLRTNASVNDNRISQTSEHLSNSQSLWPPSASHGPSQSSGLTPLPAITVSPSVPITEVLPSAPAPEETSASHGPAQSSGLTPLPAITVLPSVPITEVLPSAPAPEETSASHGPSQSSGLTPLPAITVSPSVPITEALPSTPAPPVNLWKEVFEKVNDETKRWIREHKLNSAEQTQPESQIAELITLLESKTLSEEKDVPTKIEIGDQKIILREYVGDVVAFLTMAGDVAMTFAPPQASAPWAAVKALLQIPVKQIEQKAALAGTTQWFTRIIRRGQVYELLYNKTTVDEQVASNLHDALRDLYIAAMELLSRSDVLFGSGMVKQTLNAILRPEQASGLVSDLSKKEQKVLLEAQICEASRSAKADMKSDQRISDVLTWLEGMSSPLRRIDEGIAKILKEIEKNQLEKLEEIDKNQLEKLMKFLSSENFGKSHATIKGQRTKNTGDWLINHQGFCDWQAIPSSTLLCLTGTVGTGKTFLTWRVIEHVKETLKTSTPGQGFAFFYCNRSGDSMQDPLIILRSFVRQLTYRENGDDRIPKTVIKKCQLVEKEGRDLDCTDCKELILDLLNLYSKTTIILDALDESDVKSYNLAEILTELMGKATNPVKVFVSSRLDREYLEAFETESTIRIDSNSQHGDIGKYLDEKLYSTRAFQGRQKETQELIRKTFTSRNGGMFRWVHLQVQRVMNCTSDDAVKIWAKEIPPDLMTAYDQLWNNMKEQRNEGDMALAARAIKWVLCSLKPLKSELLLEAIRYDLEGDALVQKGQQSEKQILSLCQDLLTIDTDKQVWTLPHASVAEFFTSRHDILGSCDAFASKILLNILMEPDGIVPLPEFLNEDEFERYKRFHIFQIKSIKDYAADLWHQHVRRYGIWLASIKGANPDAQLVASLKRFLGSPEETSDYHRKWVDSRDRVDSRKWGDSGWRPEDRDAPWITMCYYGFSNILRDWWESDTIKDIGQKEASEMLYLATKGKSLTACRHLLSVTDVNDPARACRAMEEAIRRGYKVIVSLLVTEAKFDVNSRYPHVYKCGAVTAVQYAIEYLGMLQWFVDQGWVDVNKGSDDSTVNPLICAVKKDSPKAIRILLQAGADVNAPIKTGPYGSVLDATLERRWENETLQMFLDKGADPNLPLKAGRWGSVLEKAIYQFSEYRYPDEKKGKSVDLLLDAGADPAMMLDPGEHGSALAAAAFYGLKYLLAAMVDITGKDRAVECLRQSRHPKVREVGHQKDFENWKHRQRGIIEYLTGIGVDKETLYRIGLWQVSSEEVGLWRSGMFYYEHFWLRRLGMVEWWLGAVEWWLGREKRRLLRDQRRLESRVESRLWKWRLGEEKQPLPDWVEWNEF